MGEYAKPKGPDFATRETGRTGALLAVGTAEGGAPRAGSSPAPDIPP